jgi:hypothetical protein
MRPSVRPSGPSGSASANAYADAPDDASANSSDTPSSPRPEEHQAKLVIATEHRNALSPTGRIVFDSGCSISGTSDVIDLAEIRCGPLQVSGTFGPPTQPSQRGKYGPLGLDAIVLPGLGAQTLVSLSQFCEGGDTGVRYVGVFTHVDFRMFRTDSVLPAHGEEVVRGTAQNGIYVLDSC